MFCKRLPNSKERRMRLLQDDQHLSDCEFLVGDSPDKEPQRFRCHKMILASASEVFERMFYNKYMMQDLTDELVKHLKQKHNWTISDVWPIFDLACLYENLPLLLLCYEKITKSVVTLLSVDSFYELNANHLKRVVILVSQQPHISTKLMLQRLEEYGRRNKLHENRESEQFFKLVEAACLLDFNKLSKADYESGLRQSYLFNKK
ncbi:PREDICTED: uncharacterized protein LOC108971455 isoform X3 [Bactrocera latifrons]|uniref:uncharacterized protein LOC108971455 isoform X3 n=1 Tax=Bactrocera latifrons TaxID=174628 RepID=UPI0008DC688B|nr:PREDICTED: uncharacterized protein LOC108971455 isoform X3 [Bactrocera latifrons]